MLRATNIQQVFSALHEDIIVQRVYQPHQMIRERFRVPVYKAGDYDDACELLSGYYAYHYQAWLGSDVVLPPDLAFAGVHAVLKEHTGFVLAVKNAIRGRDGGLIALIDKIVEHFQKTGLENYMRYVLDQLISPLDFDQVIAFSRQYLRQYGRHLLPGEELMSAYELAANLETVIRYHLQVMSALRARVQ